MTWKLSPLKQFVLAAVLWLPAFFFIWAWFSSPVVWPIAKLAHWALTTMMPDTITAVVQNVVRLEIETKLITVDPSGRSGILVLEANPLIYTWCLPLLAGLIMATPLTALQRVKQFAVGLPVLWLVAGWGAVFDALYLLQFKSGPLGEAALAAHGWSADTVGLGYQFGYLILPSVTPIALWITQNRKFLESLIGWTAEPSSASAGPSAGNE